MGQAARRSHMLVVDDEFNIGDIIRKHLHGEWTVDIEQNGALALERLMGPEWFDLILLDVILPHLSGVEIYRRLQKDFPERLKRIIVITGGDIIPGVTAFLKEMAQNKTPFLLKPFSVDEILNVYASQIIGINGSNGSANH